MKLYHGSNIEVKNPDLKYSNKTRDFGKGFYLTTDIEQAQTWADKKALKLGSGKSTVTIFEIEENELANLKVKKFEKADEEWFDYVLKNRQDITYYDNYDIVIGPIANDGTYEVINLFTRNILTKEQAILQLKSYKLKDQYTFKTDNSLNKLKYRGVLE